jgi:transcriptional regulator
MHTPSHFEERQLSALHALMRAHPFATLITATPEGINADHIPLLLVESEGSCGLIRGHVARANPLWQNVSDGSDVLAIFQGPNRYISPKWYPSKQEHGRVVPTWNYLVVHGRGSITWHHDLIWLRKLLEALTDVHEDSELPWRVSDAPEDFVERMLSAIVGFEIRIADLKGMWKLSQNRSAEDRLGVIAGLKSQSNAAAAEMLDWMSDLGGGA